MNPEHQKLAEAECNELLQQGLIEPSDSQWACEAFYVNKRSEQARGKLRLSRRRSSSLVTETLQPIDSPIWSHVVRKKDEDKSTGD
ncbi:hypothetical protein V6N11_033528 [Hibiscus sabdariffa]|uniref:Uncharacterized protein n=1 Tax=Hibiscus sabdariffa TaxID=183260 RepID=A0ABR2PYC9_9ROSI